jgi:hypothetical protein
MEVTLGFIVEGSTGFRALQIFKGLPRGAQLETFDLARRLSVKPGALHQLLANAVKLRLIRKRYRKGIPQIAWTLGAGNESATIEYRPAKPIPSDEDVARRRERAERRRVAAESAPPPPKFQLDSPWPPGFVSKFDAQEVRAREFRPGWLVHVLKLADAREAAEAATAAPPEETRWNFSPLASARKQLLSPPAAVRKRLARSAEAAWA